MKPPRDEWDFDDEHDNDADTAVGVLKLDGTASIWDGPRLSRRRMSFLLMVLLLILAVIGGRTIYLQSVEADTLQKFADGQQQNTQALPAVRGDILDRNGQEMAVGEEAVTFYATPSALHNPAATTSYLADLLKLKPKQENQLLERLSADNSGFAYVSRQVPRALAKKVIDARSRQDEYISEHPEVKRPDNRLSGVGWYDEERRLYPLGHVAGQLLGRTDIDGKGIAGIEALYDTSLHGRPGKQVVVRDPAGTPIDVLSMTREIDGRDVQLTIDATLQTEAERVLAQTVKHFQAKAGTVIVMNPRTGAIYAMANNPTVDPNKWGSASFLAQRNQAITDTYEPGSTFKVVTISAALEEQFVTPSMSFLLPGELKLCNEKKNCTLHDSHVRGTERMDTTKILVESSNIGTVTIAKMMGRTKLVSWIHRYGFLAPTGIDFPGEVQGLMLDPKDWNDATIGNVPIGQSIGVTPIQLAAAYATIANDGVSVQPHLLKRVGDETEMTPSQRRVLSVKTARQMQAMFGKVVTDEHGTGKKASIPNYEVAGKTGTSNVVENGKYVKKYIASFVGFVPARNPQLVTLVVVKEPNSPYGGDVAAPAFEQITSLALNYFAIPPDGVM